MRLAGSVVVVTGASRGIGRATVRLLAARGATVVCVGRDEPALRQVAADVNGSVVVLDVADPDSAREIVAHTMAEHGRLDAIVANAGVGYAGEFARMSAAGVVELVDVNVRAPMLLALAGVDALRKSADPEAGPGAIVFVSSIAGAVGVPGESVYSSTKAALDAFAIVLREELRPEGISVSTVVPGVVDTDFHRLRAVPYDRRFPRPLPPERVAGVVVRALETGAERLVVPRWLAVPARLAAVAPHVYRRLARRFG